ncbi:MAG: class I SAM-dependent DNA methyltransferase [Bacteroidales bacterium]|nr:class I SAM-dependent DNA methyltransferase [Bacteroidales bacterium]
MAKKVQLSYKEIEERLRILKDNTVDKHDVGYRLLYAFGKPESELKRYREGKGVIKTFDGLLVKGLLCYKASTTLRFASELEELKRDAQVLKAAPKIIAVSDGTTIRAYDLRQRETFEQQVGRLYCDFEFFYPLAGVERIEYVEESPADIKAAEKLAKLHDEIRAYNEFTSDSDLHDLNTFIARLLFCFFAEDTGIFASNVFTHAIETFALDGRSLKDVLEQMFRFMGGKPIPDGSIKTYCQRNFAYVGGGLFERGIYIPELSMRARQIIIESGELDWQDINPDIFGSMIQAVVNPDVRANQGMHYTSVPNIMKVINPLFLEELRGELTAIEESWRKVCEQETLGVLNTKQVNRQRSIHSDKCNNLLERMSRMKFFDPACGSGNFLIITYKMLRILEMDILKLQQRIQLEYFLNFNAGSKIRIEQFYGIELLDFPHEVAMLSLWLAQHQMNKKFTSEFGVDIDALPLQDIHNIRCGNACRVDWNEVCPHTTDEEVFVFGNPPYLGYVLQDERQKADIEYIFKGIVESKKIDYICCWFFKAGQFIQREQNNRFAFVSTNSICQGEQVALLWPPLFALGLRICFAYTSFKWVNNAKYNAGVTCVIVGLDAKKDSCTLFTNANAKKCEEINPYLISAKSCIVQNSNTPICSIPTMSKGSQPTDDGNLLLTDQEKVEILELYPQSHQFIKRFYGSSEFIKDETRYCIWIEEKDRDIAYSIPPFVSRFQKVQDIRLKSSKEQTREMAKYPYLFGEIRNKYSSKVIVPSTSSERRPYIPIGYLNAEDVISNSAFAIYDAPLWLFGILTSRIHMDWVRAVGGRLKTDYRYSAGLCYNTFPFPAIGDTKKAEIEEAATDILLTREPYLTMGKTLADLYDPDTMPDDLREAHQRLDTIVESCYPGAPFASDEARLECLFKLYEKMTSKDK